MTIEEMYSHAVKYRWGNYVAVKAFNGSGWYVQDDLGHIYDPQSKSFLPHNTLQDGSYLVALAGTACEIAADFDRRRKTGLQTSA